MSEAKENEAPKKKKGKLLIVVVATVLLLAGGGGAGWFFLMKPKADFAQRADAERQNGSTHNKSRFVKRRKSKADSNSARLFVQLDPFTANLRDEIESRFAQVTVVFQVDDAQVETEFKNLMPALRNAILMILSSKSANELLTLEGKQRMALEIAEAGYALLINEPVPLPKSDLKSKPQGERGDERSERNSEPRHEPAKLSFEDYDTGPITAVHFSNFIVQ